MGALYTKFSTATPEFSFSLEVSAFVIIASYRSINIIGVLDYLLVDTMHVTPVLCPGHCAKKIRSAVFEGFFAFICFQTAIFSSCSVHTTLTCVLLEAHCRMYELTNCCSMWRRFPTSHFF